MIGWMIDGMFSALPPSRVMQEKDSKPTSEWVRGREGRTPTVVAKSIIGFLCRTVDSTLVCHVRMTKALFESCLSCLVLLAT
jgi:hypothetical protein